MGDPITSLMDSPWKPWQHDQNFPMEESHCRTNTRVRKKKEIQKGKGNFQNQSSHPSLSQTEQECRQNLIQENVQSPNFGRRPQIFVKLKIVQNRSKTERWSVKS